MRSGRLLTESKQVVAFPGGFTILMATYRADDPRLLECAVESVYTNTIQPDDFVLVVDGPVPTELAGAIAGLERRYPLRLLRLPRNQGLASALNAGLALVRTEWVARADADDINLPYRFEAQASAVLASGDRIDLLGGAILEVDRTGDVLGVRKVPVSHRDICAGLRLRSPFNHQTVAFRASVVRDAGGYPHIFCKEDYALWATLLAKGARCANLDSILVHASAGREMYRRRGGLKYIASEFELQRHMTRLGLKGRFWAFVHCAVRAGVYSMPSAIRGWIYESFLRVRPTASLESTPLSGIGWEEPVKVHRTGTE